MHKIGLFKYILYFSDVYGSSEAVRLNNVDTGKVVKQDRTMLSICNVIWYDFKSISWCGKGTTLTPQYFGAQIVGDLKHSVSEAIF